MVVNFRVHGISQDVRKLTRTPTLIKKLIICFFINKNDEYVKIIIACENDVYVFFINKTSKRDGISFTVYITMNQLIFFFFYLNPIITA
jgi:hypothetical protein